MDDALILKYANPVPRYTSYPDRTAFLGCGRAG